MQLNSLVEDAFGSQRKVKVSNFQALLDNNYKHTQGPEETPEETVTNMI